MQRYLLTLSAFKYLASVKGVGKAFWCTSAHAYHFKRYTENNNKLYIIRNVKYIQCNSLLYIQNSPSNTYDY